MSPEKSSRKERKFDTSAELAHLYRSGGLRMERMLQYLSRSKELSRDSIRSKVLHEKRRLRGAIEDVEHGIVTQDPDQIQFIIRLELLKTTVLTPFAFKKYDNRIDA